MSEEMVSSRELNKLYAADFSPDGRYLALSIDYRDILILDAATFEEVRTLHNDSDIPNLDIDDLKFSPDGRLIATASGYGVVQLWDVDGDAPLRVLAGHPWIVWRLAFNPSGTLLASLGWDDGIRLWGRGSELAVYEPPTPTPAPTFTPTPVPVLAVGGSARVRTTDGDVLNMRNSPSRAGELLTRLNNATALTIVDGPQQADGLTWWKVQTADGLEGWVVEAVDGEQTLIPTA